ncbi:MAG TPA: efflux transporter outer membrane subunit [Phenylobacterium sp.]|nr:efflux transporter outer membrane subunit [Phenylobacterium sp.]
MSHFRNAIYRNAQVALFAGAAAAVLSACASVPHLGAAPQPKASSAYAASQSFAAPAAEWPADRWWDAYGDAQLKGLIDEALSGAPTLVQAEARVRKAQSFAEQTGASLKPQLGAEASVMESKQSYNQGVPSAFVPHGWREVGRAGLDLSWQLDLFGKNRALLKAATSETQAARADAAFTRLQLSTAVAGAYADLAQLYADRDAAQEAVRVRYEGEQLIGQRYTQGLETKAAYERAHAGRAAGEAQLAALDEAIGLTRNNIAALLGQGPDRGLMIARPNPGAIRAFGLPQNLAADLMGRRPDVVAARLAAEAAGQRIKAAKADFYPNVNLMGFLGAQSLGLDMLTKSGSTLGAFGPAVSLPIFSGGRLEGAYRGARADYDAAVAAYDATLTQALREVADAAVSSRALDARLAKSREALTASETAYDLARQRYARGLGTYLEVLAAEDALVADRRAVADLETRAFTLDVALVRALGGGFHA